MGNRNGYDRTVQPPVPVRLNEEQMEGIDLAVEEGAAASRADALRRAVDKYLGRLQSARSHEAFLESYRQMPLTEDEKELARSHYRGAPVPPEQW